MAEAELERVKRQLRRRDAKLKWRDWWMPSREAKLKWQTEQMRVMGSPQHKDDKAKLNKFMHGVYPVIEQEDDDEADMENLYKLYDLDRKSKTFDPDRRQKIIKTRTMTGGAARGAGPVCGGGIRRQKEPGCIFL